MQRTLPYLEISVLSLLWNRLLMRNLPLQCHETHRGTEEDRWVPVFWNLRLNFEFFWLISIYVLTAKLSMHVVITISGQVSGQFSKQSPRQFSFCKASRLPFNECGPSMQSVVEPRVLWCQDVKIAECHLSRSFAQLRLSASHRTVAVVSTWVDLWSADNPAWLINIRLVPIYIAWLQYWNLDLALASSMIKIPLACVVTGQPAFTVQIHCKNPSFAAPSVILEALNCQSVVALKRCNEFRLRVPV